MRDEFVLQLLREIENVREGRKGCGSLTGDCFQKRHNTTLKTITQTLIYLNSLKAGIRRANFPT